MAEGREFVRSLRPNFVAPVTYMAQAMREVARPSEATRRPTEAATEWAFTGSMVVDYHALQTLGTEYLSTQPPRVFSDVDVALRSLRSLRPQRTRELFAVAHRHQPTEHGLYVALVPRVNPYWKIDGFTLFHPSEVMWVPFSPYNIPNLAEIPVLSPEALMVASIGFLNRRVQRLAGGGHPRRYLDQITTLGRVVNRRRTRQRVKDLWYARYPDAEQGPFQAATDLVKAVSQYGEDEPASLRRLVAKVVLGTKCTGCDYSNPEWPILSNRRLLLSRIGHTITTALAPTTYELQQIT